MSSVISKDALKKKKIRSKNYRKYGRASALENKQKNTDDEKFLRKQSRFYSTKTWYNMRERVLRKANFQCQACKKIGGKLHVDHIRKIAPETWDIRLKASNLQVLCEECHAIKTACEVLPKEVENADFIFDSFT